LSQRLRDRQLFACKFRRQHPIGPYIADFCCVEAQLVIELDGSQHRDKHKYDAARTEHLEALGYTVVRFWNSQVLEHVEVAVETIRRALEERS
jgi:very-short-patch-repair endonuclease